MAGALVGGAFLSAALQVLFDRLASPELLNLFRDRKQDASLLFRKLKLKLLVLDKVLYDAENQQIVDPSLGEWLDDLKDAVFCADDLLDEIATEAMRQKSEAEYQSCSSSPNQVRSSITLTSPSLLLDTEIVSKIEKLVDTFDCFTNDIEVLGLKKGSSGHKMMSGLDRSPSISLVDESVVFGRDHDKEKIILKLLDLEEASGIIRSNKILDVIPIVGMGGVGKTTLAQLVYNDNRVVNYFHVKVWVHVSDDFDVIRIAKKILIVLDGSMSYESMDLEMLLVKLKESLAEKKFLIVLDDVWNEDRDHWDTLRLAFTSGACGSKIIATTRNSSVASLMQPVPEHVLRLLQLSDEDCWLLFAKIAFDHTGDSKDHPKLENIGKEIVNRRCKGLPLAAKTISGLLRSTLDVEEWENILESKIWAFPPGKNDILPALRLSYHYLSPHLKQCFAYCSLFPKDYEFQKEELVLLWMAQNFVQHPQDNKTLEKVGDEYFLELLSRSFFQQSSRNESRFVMHDLVHDLAQVVSGQFSFTLNDVKQQNVSPKVRHFSYLRSRDDGDDGYERFMAIDGVKCLRTFLSSHGGFNDRYGKVSEKTFMNDILSTQRCLRVLSLSNCRNIKEVPSTAIGNLIHLKYLDLSGTNIEQLPEIVCTLYNLQTLLLCFCASLTALPAEIGKLICLRHLDIRKTKLREMPMHMSRLKGLQTLTDFVVGKCSGSAVINELKDLNHLRRKLTISGLQNVTSSIDAQQAKLEEKKHLEELVLEWGFYNTTEDSQTEREVLEKLKPHRNMKKLEIKNYGGTRFPTWLGHGSYSNMVCVKLENCEHCFSLPPLGQLSSLKHLTIARMNGIRKVGPEFYGDGSSFTRRFQSLETLCFEDMKNWEEWNDVSGGAGEFSQLKQLEVINCPKLVGSLPKDLPHWARLEIWGCPRLVLASLPSSSEACKLVVNGCNAVELGWSGLTSLVTLRILCVLSLTELRPDFCTLTNLKELKIWNCPRLLSLPDLCTLTNLKELMIRGCPRLLSLPNSLLPPALTRLEIEDCNGLQHSLLEGRTMCLNPRLKEIRIVRCPKLVLFCPAPQTLSEEKSTERCSQNNFLEKLDLQGCDSVRSLPLGLFTELRTLYILDCPSLDSLETLSNSIPEEEGHGGLQNLTEITIRGCPNMVSFPRGGLPAPNLIRLTVRNCERLEALPERMHTLLPSLRTLVIDSCPEIESFPEGGLPSNLQSLRINNCEKLVVETFPKEGLLPSTVTDIKISQMQNLKSLDGRGLQHLTSLKHLSISYCPQLQSLPEEGLPSSLSRLFIWKCPLLTPRCERDRGDDCHKIAHIASIWIDSQVIGV